MVALVRNCPTVSYQDHTLPPPPPKAHMKFRSIWVNCKLLWYFSLATSKVVAIKLYKLLITAESSNTITGISHSIGATNFTTQDFNRLMQLKPFYFDIQINVSPWSSAQKTSVSHVASFPHMCKLQEIIFQCHTIRFLCNFASREIRCSSSSLRRIKKS